MSHKRFRLATVVPVSIALAGIALAGCSGGSSSDNAAPPTSPTATVTTTVTSTPTTVVTAPATTPATATTPPACADGAIKIGLGRQGAAAGSNVTVVVFHNVTTHSCYLRGYPGVTPYVDAEKGTPAERTTSTMFGNGTVHSVLLEPAGAASAVIAGSDTPRDGKKSCPSYTSIRVTPPNLYDSTTLNVGIPACARLEVLPIIGGTRGSTIVE
jgi:hypothetical protein